MPKIHYQRRNKPLAICSIAGNNPDLTNEIKKVTCKMCQKIMTGKTWESESPTEKSNSVGRPKGNRQNIISGKVTDDAYTAYLALSEGTRWAKISQLLESLLNE